MSKKVEKNVGNIFLLEIYLYFCIPNKGKVIYGNGAMVACGSPTPLIRVQILVPVQRDNEKVKIKRP